MRHSHKMLLNTAALYFKIIVRAVVLLFSTRIVLRELGASDYGLYNLIAGVIALLSFLNGSLLISTQRFLSIAIGEKNEESQNSIFNASLLIHVVMALLMAQFLAAAKPFLFNGIINVGAGAVGVARDIYNVMILSAVVTISGIPYSAAINAKEDLFFFAVSEIIAVFVQLIAAIAVMFCDSGQLIIYTWIMMSSVLIGFFLKFFWCRHKYSFVSLDVHRACDKTLIRRMLGFVGWNTLGTSAVMLRNQGVAMVLNFFFGVLANAAYGVANQINALVLTFSSTLTMVFTPAIIQSKGAGDNERMMYLAIFSSKVSFFLSCLIAIPLLWNLDTILRIWLETVPQHTQTFSQCVIMAFLFTQIYPGINRAIYATGRIKGYQISIFCLLSSTIPLGIVAYQFGMPIQTILWIMVITQMLVYAATLYYAHKLVGLDVGQYLFGNALRSISLCGASIAAGVLCQGGHLHPAALFAASILVTMVFVTGFYKYVFSEKERSMANGLIVEIVNKIKV